MYRICENENGYYKIQEYRGLKILGFETRKKWRDACFYPMSCNIMLFKTKEEARKMINKFIEDDKKKNNNWDVVAIIEN